MFPVASFPILHCKLNTMRRIYTLFFLLIALNSTAQFDRQSVTTRWSITAGTGLLTAGAFWLEQRVEPLQEAQILDYRKETFSGIAAFPVRFFDKGAAKASDVLVIAAAMLPATAFLFENGREDWLNAGHLYLQTGFLNYTLTTTVKSLVQRPRPFVYNPDVPIERAMERDARLSFFSGHTSTAASFCFLSASLIQEYSNNRAIKTAGWITAGIIPAVVGYLRMKAGKHFFSDVLVGYITGAGIGLTVPLIHRRNDQPVVH